MKKTGILLSNLGTPTRPSFWPVRAYLKEFLSDPMVIDLPRLKWWLILNLIILNIRPFRSGKNYRKIWQKEGSPLLIYSQKIKKKLQAAFPNMPVALGMRYGKPSLLSAIQELHHQGVTEIFVLTLYPQYSDTTTGTTAKATSAYPEIRSLVIKKKLQFKFSGSYNNHPLYIKALKDSIETYWQTHGKPQKLILSYHGLPKRYVEEKNDPYLQQCEETTKLLREALGVSEDFAMMTFQSRVGLEEWLRPYTMDAMTELPKIGVENIQLICPGFACDCLETLEEIDLQNREAFINAGGRHFGYIPCLNDSDAQILLLQDLVTSSLP